MQKGDYAEIGTLLRQAREAMYITLDEAGQQLHIRTHYLQAIEEGRFNDLPGPTYVRGYLLAYAVFLDLDKREIIRRFEQMEGMLARSGFYLPQVLIHARGPSAALVWGGLAGALLLYVFWLAAVRPERVAMSPVEPLPRPSAAITRIPAAIFTDVACLRPQDVYYPPCHVTGAAPFSLLPLSGRGEVIRAQQEAAIAERRKPKPPPRPQPEEMEEEKSPQGDAETEENNDE